MTEFKYRGGQKAYLSAILNLYDNTIVSYVLGRANNNNLVFQTVKLAIKAAPGSNPMLHSDRGFQYTSLKFKTLFSKKVTQSMSRVGRCMDNGPMEAFLGNLKCERYYLHSYSSFTELKQAIDTYHPLLQLRAITSKTIQPQSHGIQDQDRLIFIFCTVYLTGCSSTINISRKGRLLPIFNI